MLFWLGAPGILIAAILLFTVKESKKSADDKQPIAESTEDSDSIEKMIKIPISGTKIEIIWLFDA